MSNLAHVNDCLTYMYYRSGDSTASPNFAANNLLYLNLAHLDLVAGSTKLIPQIVASFPWAKSAQPKTLTLVPSETGTATVTQNSSTITFGAAPALTKVGYHIKFGSTDETTYRIETHTAATTAATLDSAVVTSSGSVSYTLFKIDYSVGTSDVLRLLDVFGSPVDPGNGSESYQLIGESEPYFRRYFPTFSVGTPTHYCALHETAGTYTVRFNKYLSTTAYKRLEIPYIPIPSDLTANDSSIPLVPRHQRQALCDLALFYRYQDTDDDRAENTFTLAAQGYQAMLKEIGMNEGVFKPFRANDEVRTNV